MLQQLQKSQPQASHPAALLEVIATRAALAEKSTSHLSFFMEETSWLSPYIHLDWILNWICTEVEAQASCCALGRQVETSMRRTGRLRVAALDATMAILIDQR